MLKKSEYISLKQLAMEKDWLEIAPNVFRDSKQRTIRIEDFDKKGYGKYYRVFSFEDGDRHFNTLAELAEFYS